MAKLYKKLKEYGKKDICPMHMPGHKRKAGVCADIDITEIDGFDNLASPKGILKEIADKAAKIYDADKAFLSVNGSTGSILSAICGVCKKGDKIIMARNCHKSVYNAAELMELDAVYIFPGYDEYGIAKSISPTAVQGALDENPDAALVVLTSPTYEGVISDIKTISEITREKNIPLFVDAAHGAHLKFSKLPDPIDSGADIAAVSLHKTLPSMTQTGLLLIKGERVDDKKISEKMSVFMTSSPSYVLMASMGECIDFLERYSERYFLDYKKKLDNFYEEMKKLKHLRIKTESDFAFDRGKIVILTNNTDISGKALMKKLRDEHKIELEMAYDNYALAMTSVCDEEKDFSRLKNALLKIDKELKSEQRKIFDYPTPEKIMIIPENAETKLIKTEEAEGLICADYIWAYPPGVPIIAPGERIDNKTIDYLANLSDTETYGRGGSDGDEILVLTENQG